MPGRRRAAHGGGIPARGVDGLNVVVPHGDALYYQARPTIAVARPGQANGALDLTGYWFASGAAAADAVLGEWPAGLRACIGFARWLALPLRSAGLYGNGYPGQHSTRDGWLNRVMDYLPPAESPLQAINVGSATPRILSGHNVAANLQTGRDATRPSMIDQPRWSQVFDPLYGGDDALGKAYRDGMAARKQLMAEINSQEQQMANNAHRCPMVCPWTRRLGRLMRHDPRIRLAFLAVGAGIRTSRKATAPVSWPGGCRRWPPAWLRWHANWGRLSMTRSSW
jgi:uncharacterized protein (DUF1501 family)